MKKILCVLCTIAIAISFAACSSSTNDSEATTVNTTAQNQTTTEDVNKIDKDIDSVAAYLGYTDGEETYYEMIGATSGKEYNDGKFELYQFDESSDAYNDIINGNDSLKAAAYKEGIVLIFPNGESGDDNIIEKFNTIEFN